MQDHELATATPDQCPDGKELELLLRGRHSDERLEAFALHLPHCSRCLALVQEIEVNSVVMHVVQDRAQFEDRQSDIESMKRNDFVQDMMAQLEELGTRASFLSEGGAGTAADEEDFAFLSPPQEKDELARLGHFRVLKLLGRGGMGLVFLAEDTQLQRKVALKVVRSKYASRPDARERFLHEARAMAAIKHDNIAVIHEVGEAEVRGQKSEVRSQEVSHTKLTSDSLTSGLWPVPFLAMEYLEGQSLAEWMKLNKRPPIEWIVRIGRQAAAGLAAAHDHGLIHRDVKPGNLWLEAPPAWLKASSAERPPLESVARVKLLDFGLVRPIGGDVAAAKFMGTPAYMSPEQLRGDDLDARSDLFALGCVLYELCAGEPAFRPDLRRLRQGEVPEFKAPKSVNNVNPKVPAKLVTLINRLLAEKPSDRPNSAEEVETKLTAIERSLRARRRLRRDAPWAAAVLGVGLMLALVWAIWPKVREALVGPRFERMTSGPTYPQGPPDETWRQFVAGLPPDQQRQAVVAKLTELNPGAEMRMFMQFLYQKDSLFLFTDVVTDLRPLQALPSLRQIDSMVTPGKGRLTDLSPLAGLQLDRLSVRGNPKLNDLRPLRETALVELDVSGCGITSLADLNGSRLKKLDVSTTPIRDLSPVRQMPLLEQLSCINCPLDSLEPLVGTKIHTLNISYNRDRDEKVLRNMPNLRTINGASVQDFWRVQGSK